MRLFCKSTRKKKPPSNAVDVLIQPRQPQAIDSDRPSLIALGTDILTLIIDFVQDSHPKSTLSLVFVNSYFHSLARYSQHRTITLKFLEEADQRQAIYDRLDCIEQQCLLPAIRELNIDPPWTCTENVTLPMAHLMPGMTGLRDVRWAGNNVPPPFLEALKRPTSDPSTTARKMPRLHTRDWWGLTDASTNLHALHANHNLHSLDIRKAYYTAQECRAHTEPLKDLLLTCPNLRILSLDIAVPVEMCVVHAPPPQYCGLGFTDGERPLAALEELVLTAYPFGTKPLPGGNGKVWPAYPYHIGYPGKVPEIEYWAETFDWSRLQRLEIGYPHVDFALMLMPKLIALKVAVFQNMWGEEEETRQFFREVPVRLEGIETSTLAHVGVEGIARHGAALRTLRIHRGEDCYGLWRKNAITAEQLARIREVCPLIVELAIDVLRHDNGWPWDTLDVLASFPRLRRLQIWFELNLSDTSNADGKRVRDDGSEPVRPPVTLSAAVMLYTHLLNQAQYLVQQEQEQQQHPPPTCPSQLKHLTLHVLGYPPRMFQFGASGPEHWPAAQPMTFTCTLSPRDDEAARGRFAVSCEGRVEVWSDEMEDLDAVLARGRKEQLREEERAMREKWGVRSRSGLIGVHWREAEGKGKTDRLRLALEGPISVSDWAAEATNVVYDWRLMRSQVFKKAAGILVACWSPTYRRRLCRGPPNREPSSVSGMIGSQKVAC
ncbi:hypothetical protein LTR85_011432 [Meristemomyces frigidus]|nr:hypothetical protein LTR85_011432 [Meristemomyces frigidus]